MDKFQGQQNDYVLLSLVRTRAVGHLRDVRRLVVAMSRARLGLYIVGRQQLFGNCYELQPTFRCVCVYVRVHACVCGHVCRPHTSTRACTQPCYAHNAIAHMRKHSGLRVCARLHTCVLHTCACVCVWPCLPATHFNTHMHATQRKADGAVNERLAAI